MQAPDWEDFYRTGRYREAWELDGPSRELAAYLQGVSGEGRVAVDLGCGTGADCCLLARSGFRACGVDISAAALELARARARTEGVQVEWWQADVLTLPLEAGSVDLATDRGCFHHIPEEKRDSYAAEVRRILRPGGRLYLRGCRVRQVPFIPVTAEALQRFFPPDGWEVSPVDPLDLRTNGGYLLANSCTIVRR